MRVCVKSWESGWEFTGKVEPQIEFDYEADAEGTPRAFFDLTLEMDYYRDKILSVSLVDNNRLRVYFHNIQR